MKRIWRQICSIMLCMIMIAGLFTPSAVALGPFTPADQIGNHFEADDSTGVLSDTPELAGDTSKSYADDWIKTNKTISAGKNENEFLITLDVRTKAEIQNIELSEDAAVVMVIDLSGSMNDDNKLEKAKAAALAFIDKFAETDNADTLRKVAVVGFSGQTPQYSFLGGREGITAAKTYQNWINATDPSIALQINKMEAKGGTCLQAGLILAKNLLNSEEVADISNKNIIVLTDGCPTYSLSEQAARNQSQESIGEPDEIQGNGSKTDHATHTKTEETAKTVLKSGINVYSVYLGNDMVDCTERSCSVRKTGANWLREDCGFTVYAVDDADNLWETFERISELIRIQAKAWIAEDPMGEMFDFSGFTNTPMSDNEYFYNSSSNKIQWHLRFSKPVCETEDGFSVYQLTYKIRLNTLASNYKAGVYYPANGITSVTWLIEKAAQSGTSEIENGTAYFNVPSVKGYATDISFHKTDNHNAALAGAVFELYYREILMDTAISDETGVVLFENVPSGHSYTIIEKSAPNGFITSTEEYSVTVSYGDVDGKIGVDNTVINLPEPKYGSLIVSKTISGGGASTTDEFTFTVVLSDNSINGQYDNMNFIDGVASFTLKGGESATASGLPAGTGYTVTESDNEGYTVTVNGINTKTASGMITAGEIAEEAFINYRAENPDKPEIRFEITKKVEATGDVIPAGKNRFEFVVSTSLNEVDAVIRPNPVIEIEGIGTQTKSITVDLNEIPEELYVWEKSNDVSVEWTYDAAVYRVTFTKDAVSGDMVPHYEKLVITGNTQNWVVNEAALFINSFYASSTPYEPVGNIQISKTVINGDKIKEFAFTVTLITSDGESISGYFGDMIFIDGVATVYLKHGESATAIGIPAGTVYSVEESNNEGYKVTVNGADGAFATGTIAAENTAVVAFQNEKDSGGTPDLGSVKITKVVKGNKAPAEHVEYAFRAWLHDRDGAAVSESIPYSIIRTDGTTENGTVKIDTDGYVFTLKDGESIIFSNIKSGGYFEVKEITTGDFTTTVRGLTDGVCEISPNSTKIVEFVNDYGSTVPLPRTGDSSKIGPWLVLACLSLLGLTVVSFVGKNRYTRW